MIGSGASARASSGSGSSRNPASTTTSASPPEAARGKPGEVELSIELGAVLVVARDDESTPAVVPDACGDPLGDDRVARDQPEHGALVASRIVLAARLVASGHTCPGRHRREEWEP